MRYEKPQLEPMDSSYHHSDASLSCLQRLVWPQAPSDVQPLYFFSMRNVGLDKERLTVSADATVSFNTLINSFYEHSWNEIAAITDLRFKLIFLGRVKLDIFRASVSAGHELVVSAIGDAVDGPLHLQIPLRTGVDTGRLFAVITALGGAAVILDGGWYSISPAKSAVTLRIVICTFNKEKFLIPNLTKLLRAFDDTTEVREIIVINQGEHDLSEHAEYQALRKTKNGDSKLKIVRQPNFGGSGGFTRGIIEALETPDTSHVLLMDDDVTFEPFVIQRLLAMLRYARADKIIGGQMLELERPTKLYASHERFSFKTQRPVNPLLGLDLADKHAIECFNKFHPSEYNGWWFCCLPRCAFEPDQRPLPFFVRGDDIEFAYRLKPGINVVTMPGIFVWHESFHFKSSNLMEYFTARNWLIVSVIHSNVSIPRLLLAFHETFWWFIVTYRYDLAHARLLALRDFLKGPSYVFTRPLEYHAKLLSSLNRYPLRSFSLRKGKTSLRVRKRKRSAYARFLLDARITIWIFLFAPKSQEPGFSSDAELIAAEYDDNEYFYKKRAVNVLNQATSQVTIQAASRIIARTLYRQLLKEFFLIYWYRGILTEYRRDYLRYTCSAHWRSYLKL